MDKIPAAKKELVGTIVSTSMQKTVTVKVTSFKQHPLYHKRYQWTKKYLTDTGSFEPKLGDTVRIVSSRPLSKLKRWVVSEVVPATVVQRQVTTKAVETKAATKAAPKAKRGKTP